MPTSASKVITFGRRHIEPDTVPHNAQGKTYDNFTWGGCGVSRGNFSAVMGSFVVPTVTRPHNGAKGETYWTSSSWFGLDGFTYGPDVLGVGVTHTVDAASGVTSYTADWSWATWDGPGTIGGIIPFSVQPGHQVNGSITYVIDGNGVRTGASIIFANNTTGAHSSFTVQAPAEAKPWGGTAQWILEALETGNGTAQYPKLPAFTLLTFGLCFGCATDNNGQVAGDGDFFDITQDGVVYSEASAIGASCTITYTG